MKTGPREISDFDQEGLRFIALGGATMGAVRMAAGASRLAPYPADRVEGMAVNDLFIGIGRHLEQWLWFLEAHLHG